MCLYLEKTPEPPVPSVAEEDITCYKFLIDKGDGKLLPPMALLSGYCHPNFHYVLGVQESSKIEWFDEEFQYIVETGLHSFVSVPDVQLTNIMHMDFSKLKLFVCTIPKGSEYYKGVWDFNQPSYASNQIIIKEEYVPVS